MPFSEGGAYWFDSMRSQLQGVDPNVFLEWSQVIEKRSRRESDNLGGRIVFRGRVDGEGKFALDVYAADSDAILSVLEAIQGSLDLMPGAPKRFYAALMEALAVQAQEKGKMDGHWHF